MASPFAAYVVQLTGIIFPLEGVKVHTITLSRLWINVLLYAQTY